MLVRNTLNMVVMETAFNLRYLFLPNETKELEDKIGEVLIRESNGRLVKDEPVEEEEVKDEPVEEVKKGKG